MMKIALCYSGYPSYFDKTFLNHKSALIDLNDAKADIFAHFWVKTHHGPGNFSRHPIKTHDKPTWKEFEKNVLKPTKIIWETPETERFKKEAEVNIHQQELKFGSGWFDELWENGLHGPSRPESALSMFYGIEKSISLALEHERAHSFKYDFIFRIRTDLFFLRNSYLHKLRKYNNSKLNVSAMRWYQQSTWTKDEHGAPMLATTPRNNIATHINDWFAFSGGEIMEKYCSAYSNCRKIIKEYLPIGPEAFLRAHIKSEGLRIDENDWQLMLYRGLASGAHPLVLKFNESFYIN